MWCIFERHNLLNDDKSYLGDVVLGTIIMYRQFTCSSIIEHVGFMITESNFKLCNCARISYWKLPNFKARLQVGIILFDKNCHAPPKMLFILRHVANASYSMWGPRPLSLKLDSSPIVISAPLPLLSHLL